MDMCAKVSGGCTHNNQQVSRDLHLGVCLSHCVFVRLSQRACVHVFVCATSNATTVRSQGLRARIFDRLGNNQLTN